jgi:iron-regulated transporter 1
MRRIDLFCKLIGPLFIAFVDGASPKIAITATGGVTVVSVLVEYWTIARVYNFVPALRASKNSPRPPIHLSMPAKFRSLIAGTAVYTRHRAFLPSLALALLYLTVLAFGGQMLTYLLSLGLSSGLIGVLRGVAAIFEMSATWIAPKVMSHIGPVRSGIWFINWQMFCVSIACAFFWLDYYPTFAAMGTVIAVIASRVGLWGFDLSAQMIVQDEVAPEHRGTFSSQEFALQNVFEMIAFASTIAFPKPDQFKYPATLSAGAVAIAGVLYAIFVRSRRGHLLHCQCVDRHRHKHRDYAHRWMRLEDQEPAEYIDDDAEENNALLSDMGRSRAREGDS